jgi:hypothetical protein
MKKVNLLIFLLFLFSISISAQKAPVKYGKVPPEDIIMQVYDLDTSAAAVILSDYGVFNGVDFNYNRNVRIKILKKSGLDWGNFRYVSPNKPRVKGITYNVIDGEIVKEKLKGSSIFSENLRSGNWETSIAMPNVSVGSVVEIEVFFDGLPMEFRFQDVIPVRYSELLIKTSQYITFNRNFFGFEPLYSQTGDRYIAIEMPAFKIEPLTSSIENYITKFEFELRDVAIPGYLYSPYTTNWESVCKYLLEHVYFGQSLRGALCLNSNAKMISDNTSDPLERLKLAFEMTKQIKWNEEVSLYSTSTGICSALRDGIGNSADINMTLYQLLKKLDIDVTPVALSTRQNGFLSIFTPTIDKFNYIIVEAKIDGKSYLLDATEKYMPYTLVPARVLNFRGRSIVSDGSDWVNLNAPGVDKEQSVFNLVLDDEMNLSGQLEKKYSEYGAFNFRERYHSYNSKTEYVDNFVRNKTGLRVRSLEVENLDDIYMPAKEVFDFTLSGYAEDLGDEIMISPMLFEGLSDNPFKLEVRNYPVDFTYGIDKTTTININIPEGYKVSEMPRLLNLKTEDDAFNVSYKVSSVGSLLTIVYTYKVNKQIFIEDEYYAIKEIHNTIIKKHAEPIILTKEK